MDFKKKFVEIHFPGFRNPPKNADFAITINYHCDQPPRAKKPCHLLKRFHLCSGKNADFAN